MKFTAISVLFLAVLAWVVIVAEEQCDNNGLCTNPDIATEGQVPSGAGKAQRIAKGSNERGEPPKASFSDCSDRYDQCVGFQQQG